MSPPLETPFYSPPSPSPPPSPLSFLCGPHSYPLAFAAAQAIRVKRYHDSQAQLNGPPDIHTRRHSRTSSLDSNDSLRSTSSSLLSSSADPSKPYPRLRRKRSPRHASLRELRDKHSEASLQRAYQEDVEAYLNGQFLPAGGLARLGTVETPERSRTQEESLLRAAG